MPLLSESREKKKLEKSKIWPRLNKKGIGRRIEIKNKKKREKKNWKVLIEKGNKSPNRKRK